MRVGRVWVLAFAIGAIACGNDDGKSEAGVKMADAAMPHAGQRAQAGGGAGGGPAGAGGHVSGAPGSAGNDAAEPGGSGALDPDAALAPDGGQQDGDAGSDSGPVPELASGSFLALTYNVAGLPEGLSSSMPARFTPMIGPLLNGYDLVFLQESWQTPDPNPLAPLRGYHEILVATANHPHKTVPCEQPFGSDPRRPTALLCDGVNVFSRIPLETTTTHVAWSTCVDTDSDCLALKGFSMTRAQLAPDLPVHLYDLHMEAGISPEDDSARAGGIDQLLAFIGEQSQQTAIIVAGDFNLNTDAEPGASQLARLLELGALSDACCELSCEQPGSIDKLLYRSSDELELRAESWERESDVFVSSSGEPLSDHAPLAVRFSWSAKPAEP
ncbi:MAG TPA: endonuclease/exonuclease/phosphatase family protein [Polyangiales bacterium]|nr:endonuclease/exonuclease/phosphatase family protein [Polyangiales bacterium]